MGVENFLLSSTVRGILAQRLLRRICPECKEVDKSGTDEEEFKALGMVRDVLLYKGSGCEACSHTGFYGRTGIFEMLIIDDEIRKLILASADANQIRAVARQRGMRTLLEDGIKKITAGETTLNEVFRVTQET
jgi:general secretion pathway protein E